MPGPCSAPNGASELTLNRTVTLCGTHGDALGRCVAGRCRHETVPVRERLRRQGVLSTGKTAKRRSRSAR